MAEERVVCNFHVMKEPSDYVHRPLMVDCFEFDVVVNRRDFTSDNTVRRISSMFRTSIRINCNSFLTHDENFLWLNLQRFSSPYLNSENLAQMTLSLISEVKEMFEFYNGSLPGEPLPSGRTAVFPLFLRILVDMHPTEERRTELERASVEVAVVEESMQIVKMIPASIEAVLSLKAYSLPRTCTICMERFHDDDDDDDDDSDVKVSTMPCGHIFHYNCILQWLQKGHVCPLCRHAMPI